MFATLFDTHTQPTIDTFISMNRKINNGKDFPVEMLQVGSSSELLVVSGGHSVAVTGSVIG